MNAELHSVRHDLHEPRERQKSSAAVLIPKALAEYGSEVAQLLALGEDLERRFQALSRLDKQLRENGCKAPVPQFSQPLRAAWSAYRGDGWWQS
jgi:hypothetical protein